MGTKNGPIELDAMELSGADLKVSFHSSKAGESSYEPEWIRVGSQGLFLPWPDPPQRIKKVHLEWANAPFMHHTFRMDGTITKRYDEGVFISYDHAAPPGLQDWLTGLAAFMNKSEPDAALKASKLYSRATIVSACGLFFGALAILLPILISERGWVDLLSKILLMLMVFSIGGFALIRAMAGKAELKAIKQSRD